MSGSNHIRAVLLDAGNTLLELGYGAIARSLSVPVRDVREAEEAVRPDLDRFLARGRYMEERPSIAAAPSPASTETLDTFAFYAGLVFDRLGWDGPRDRVVASLRRDPGIWTQPFPGAAEALEALHAAGLRLAVVSNADGRVGRVLADAGLTRRIAAVIDSGLVGMEKPDPRPFRLALEALGVAPEEAVHVGDLPSIDGLGAQAAGVAFILVDPAGAFGRAGSIRGVSELSDCLRRSIQ